MIRTQTWGNRTIYFTDSQKEWDDLVKRRQTVYSETEVALLHQQPNVLDSTFQNFLFRAKILQAEVLVLGVRPCP